MRKTLYRDPNNGKLGGVCARVWLNILALKFG